jgi:hypothetical protein
MIQVDDHKVKIAESMTRKVKCRLRGPSIAGVETVVVVVVVVVVSVLLPKDSSHAHL